MMVQTTVRGTARRAFHARDGSLLLDPVPVAGKTGSLNGKDPDGHYEWFIGVAPADDPTIADRDAGGESGQMAAQRDASRRSGAAGGVLRVRRLPRRSAYPPGGVPSAAANRTAGAASARTRGRADPGRIRRGRLDHSNRAGLIRAARIDARGRASGARSPQPSRPSCGPCGA